jgi:hypothetical protein
MIPLNYSVHFYGKRLTFLSMSPQLIKVLQRLYFISLEHPCQERPLSDYSHSFSIHLVPWKETLARVYPSPSISQPDSASCFLELMGASFQYHEGLFYSYIDTPGHSHEVHIDLKNQTLWIRYGSQYEDDLYSLYPMLRILLDVLVYPLLGFKGFHGAGLAKNGDGFFLTGDSGAGKSTAALSLLPHGFQLLSDDTPLFRFQDNHLFLHGALDAPRVWGNTFKVLPFLKPYALQIETYTEKKILNRLEMPSSWFEVGPIPLKHYIKLNRVSDTQLEEPFLKPLPKIPLLQDHLQRSLNIFKDPQMLRDLPCLKTYSELVFKAASTLVSQPQCYELTYQNHHLERLPQMLTALTQKQPLTHTP